MGESATAAAAVALVAHRIADPAPSGIGRYYRELILALARDGGATRLVAVTPREADRPGWLPREVEYQAIPGPRRAVQFCWSALRRPRIDPWIGGVDVVHALHTWAPVPTRRPLVVTVHDLIPVLSPDWYRRDHRWAIRQGVRYCADRADRLIADSAWVASQVESELGVAASRIRVVPLGASDRFRLPSRPEQARAIGARFGLADGGYLLALGQGASRKNLSTVLRALAALGPEESQGLPLVVAGAEGPATADLVAEAGQLGLSNRLRLLGYVPDDLLPAVVAGARLLVHPSFDEGFGLTPIEAMAAGTPVIASRAGALPEVVGDAGLLVGALDVDAWAAAMGQVIGDDDERKRLIDAGSRRQAAFTWAATARATLGVYEEVLRGASPR